jgi:predicted DNA-binding transcriptional regulator AlpA
VSEVARLLDSRHVAEKVGMSVPWLKKAVKKGDFPAPQVAGAKNLWREEVVDRWIEEVAPLPAELQPKDAA